jgi:DNA polymerase I-like protein with 3'-5' exonuclease and polymerase domains
MLFGDFDPSKPLCVDTETISNDDKRGGLLPYHGDRMAGVAFCQGEHAIYLPLRHRNDLAHCLPFESTIKEIREFMAEVKIWRNLNIKFDAHVLAQDNIFAPKARLEDTGTLARVVNNKLNISRNEDGEEEKDDTGYSLQALTNRFNKKYKKSSDELNEWCVAHGTKDYGAIPIPIISKYARFDTLSCYELHEILLTMLPEEAVNVWETEIRFCPILWGAERTGVKVDPSFFEAAGAALARRMLHSQKQIDEGVDWRDKSGNLISFNAGSWKQKDDYFRSKGIEPVAWGEPNKQGIKNACWDGDALSQLFISEKNVDGTENREAKRINQVINGIIDYSEAKTAYSTYCVGWMDRKDKNNVLHPGYNPAGTRTGRISSSNPNMQNPPPWAMKGMILAPGEIGIKYDYSQIEYRIFAHFARDEALINLYLENPYIDFHQIVADRLGMGKHRKIIKPINFGILYGMGKKKLIRQLAKTIHDLKDPELTTYLLYKYGGDRGTMEEVAANILEEYHRLTPAVKTLLNDVKKAIHAKGYIRNLYKRHLQFDIDKAYVALNYLCQGSAADLFKERTCAVFYDPDVVASGAQMVFNIHDSIGSLVKSLSAGQLYWDRAKVLAVKADHLRVPILIDGEVAIGTWDNTVEIYEKDKKTGRVVRERSIEECVELLKAA